MTISEMLEKRAAKVTEMETLTKPADTDKRCLNADEQKKFGEIRAEIEGLDKDIELRRAQDGIVSHGAALAAAAKTATREPQRNFSQKEMRDLEGFNICKFLKGASGARLDGIEAEMAQEGAEERQRACVSGGTAQLILPSFVASFLSRREKRAMSVTGDTATLGGKTVATQLGELSEVVRDETVLGPLGVTVMSGLVGNLDMPVQTSVGGTLAAKSETGSAVKLSPVIAKVSFTPKRIPGQTEISNQLLAQSSLDAQGFVSRNLNETIMGLLQRNVIGGDGSIFTGLLGETGLGSVTTGSTPAALTWAKVCEFIGKVDSLNGSKLGWLINNATLAALMGKAKGTGEGYVIGDTITGAGSRILAGYQAAVSNCTPNSLTVGSGETLVEDLSAVIFGDWSKLMVGMWGGIGLIVDPYTKAGDGTTVITAELFADSHALRPSAFAVCKDVVTS